MKSAGKARNNGLYRHIRTSKEIIRNLLNDSYKCFAFNLPGSFFLPINLRYNLYVYFKLVKNTTRKERKSYEEISRIIARNGFNTCLMCLRFSAGTANRTCKAGGCRIRSTAGTT